MRRTGRIEGAGDEEDSDCSMTSCSSVEAGASSRRGQGQTQTQGPVVSEPMRVLAVDDNNIDRKLIEMLLKTSSFTVTTVNSAKKALEVLGLSGKVSPTRGKESEFDLIITDYCMPEMTGYDLLTRAKDDSSEWKDIPVVIMSSENRPRRINRCMAAGASEFLIKPVQLADVQRLKGHIREARELRAEFANSPAASSKRKGSATTTSGRQGQGMERRTRRELTVA